MCTPGSSAPRRVARHSRDKQNPSTSAAPTKRRRSSSRRETSLETAKAIGPWPLRAPSRPPQAAIQLSPHTTSRATWDSGISLLDLGEIRFPDNLRARNRFCRDIRLGGDRASRHRSAYQHGPGKDRSRASIPGAASIHVAAHRKFPCVRSTDCIELIEAVRHSPDDFQPDRKFNAFPQIPATPNALARDGLRRWSKRSSTALATVLAFRPP